jgi:hypothetical protein
VDSPGSGWGPLAGCCECGDEPSGPGDTELVSCIPHVICDLQMLLQSIVGWRVNGYRQLNETLGAPFPLCEEFHVNIKSYTVLDCHQEVGIFQ